MAQIGKFKLSDAIPPQHRPETDGDKAAKRAPTHETTADAIRKPGRAKRSGGVSRRRIGDA